MFSRKLPDTELPEIPTGVQTLKDISEDELCDYVSEVTEGVLCDFVIFTPNFNKVKAAISLHRKVSLMGPKGCGKSLLCAIMYLIFEKNLPCLYITPQSFKYSTGSCDYFINFCNKHQSDLKDSHKILERLEFTTHFQDGVVKLVRDVTKSLYLFADFSFARSKDTDLLTSCLKTLRFVKQNLHVIVSLSNGADHLVSDVRSDLRAQIDSVIKDSEPIVITDFTEAEARTYIEIKQGDGTVSFYDIKHCSGRNPYLLSFFQSKVSVMDYESLVQTRVTNFMVDNLKLEKGNSKNVYEYILHKGLESSRKYVYYACRGDTISETDLRDYSKSLLSKHWLSVMEEVEGEDLQRKVKTLRGNFPLLGELLIDVLTNFVTQSKNTVLEEVCRKEPSSQDSGSKQFF